jgi:hypothetical protein
MKLRTVYLKVNDMERPASFWQQVLESEPHRKSATSTQFMLGKVRQGLLLNNFGDDFNGSAAVPGFEFDDEALCAFLNRAKASGATVVFDGLVDDAVKKPLS